MSVDLTAAGIGLNVLFLDAARRERFQLGGENRRRFGPIGTRLEVRAGAEGVRRDAEDPRPEGVDVVDEENHPNSQLHRSAAGALESSQRNRCCNFGLFISLFLSFLSIFSKGFLSFQNWIPSAGMRWYEILFRWSRFFFGGGEGPSWISRILFGDSFHLPSEAVAEVFALCSSASLECFNHSSWRISDDFPSSRSIQFERFDPAARAVLVAETADWAQSVVMLWKKRLLFAGNLRGNDLRRNRSRLPVRIHEPRRR